MLTCIIRHQIDPTKGDQFARHARNGGQARPAADPLGRDDPSVLKQVSL